MILARLASATLLTAGFSNGWLLTLPSFGAGAAVFKAVGAWDLTRSAVGGRGLTKVGLAGMGFGIVVRTVVTDGTLGRKLLMGGLATVVLGGGLAADSTV